MSTKTAHCDPQSCPPAYLIQNDDGQLNWKENHPHHTQVVMQLAVTYSVISLCTPHGYHMQRIYKYAFLNLVCELQQAASNLFTTFLVPKLCASTTVSTTTKPTIDSPDTHPHSSVQQVNSAVNAQLNKRFHWGCVGFEGIDPDN